MIERRKRERERTKTNFREWQLRDKGTMKEGEARIQKQQKIKYHTNSKPMYELFTKNPADFRKRQEILRISKKISKDFLQVSTVFVVLEFSFLRAFCRLVVRQQNKHSVNWVNFIHYICSCGFFKHAAYGIRQVEQPKSPWSEHPSSIHGPQKSVGW